MKPITNKRQNFALLVLGDGDPHITGGFSSPKACNVETCPYHDSWYKNSFAIHVSDRSLFDVDPKGLCYLGCYRILIVTAYILKQNLHDVATKNAEVLPIMACTHCNSCRSWWRHQKKTFSESPLVTGPLWGESTGRRWIPLPKAGDAELWCFLWPAPEQTVEQTIETLVIWDTIALIMMLL